MKEIFQDESLNLLEKISRFFGNTALGRVAFVVCVLLVSWVVIQILMSVVKSLLKKSRMDDAGNVMIARIIRIVLWILVIMSLLSSLGVSMAPFLTILATAGAAIALALKDSLSNLSSGIILIVTKPFGKGDKIEVNGVAGAVEAIDIMSTSLLTVSGKRIVVPNSVMTSNIITNHTKLGQTQFEKVHVFSRSTDVLKAQELIRQAIHDEPLILEDPAPYVGITEQNGNTVTVSIGFWVDLSNYGKAGYNYEERIRQAFDANGIALARQTLDVAGIETPKAN